jgi:hypothetical protein
VSAYSPIELNGQAVLTPGCAVKTVKPSLASSNDHCTVKAFTAAFETLYVDTGNRANLGARAIDPSWLPLPREELLAAIGYQKNPPTHMLKITFWLPRRSNGRKAVVTS